ncbi:hypothetical protein JXC34_07120 [Candidatus Woesearchaeota archaeon]|nr:hypothetical protein [Candidatus Woesearchaeota archaeon]
MNPIVKKDILNVLHQAIEIVKNRQLYKLRELSDHVIHNASIFQDKESVTIAVTIYSLSKIYQSSNNIDKFVLPHLMNAVAALEKGILNKYESEIKHLITDISKKDKKTNLYVQQVLERAQIKKASKMFEHGISMGQVADTLGISLWDLMDYVGKTKIVDRFDYKTDVSEKLEFTRGLFK